MTWFGKTLVVLNTVVSLALLGAITWMVLEWRQFRDDVSKVENQIKQQQDQLGRTRETLAGLLKEKEDGNRLIVWETRGDGKKLVPQETIPVHEARRRINELENGAPGKPSLAQLDKELNRLHLEGAKLRDELDKAQYETRWRSDELARISKEARAIVPAPGGPNPVEELHQQKRELEVKIRDLDLPLHHARHRHETVTARLRELQSRERELTTLEQVPPFKPFPGTR